MSDVSYKPGETVIWEIPNYETLSFAWCPRGKFTMGIPKTGELADNIATGSIQVTFEQGFWISQHVITNIQWYFIMGHDYRFLNRDPYKPADYVNWIDAKIYCKRLTIALQRNRLIPVNYYIDLPTEAQWEYAARAGIPDTVWHFGNEAEMLKDYGWFADNSKENEGPYQVGQKLPNPWNIYDMYGNVAEWCLDDALPYGSIYDSRKEYYNPQIYSNEQVSKIGNFILNNERPISDCFKIVRGGDYLSYSERCHSSYRGLQAIQHPHYAPIGVRLVCNTTKPTLLQPKGSV